MEEVIENNNTQPTIDNLMKLASINEVCRDSEYRNKFLKILDGKRFVWNWAAFFVTILPIWAIYRKIYWLAFLSKIPLCICFLCWCLLSLCIPVGTAFGVALTVFVVGMSLLGFGGNYLYYQHLRGKIKRGYHLAPNIKNVDIISCWLLVPPFAGLALARVLIVYVIDRRKSKKHQMLRDTHHNLRS